VKEVPDPCHPNSPLVEVVFQIRFPGETVIECKRHEIQDKIRDDYPNLLVPPVHEGAHIALEPYSFEKEDQSSGLMVALNSFAYYCREYPGFEAFESECLRLLDMLGSIVPLKKLNRVGLRHINLIPFVKEDGRIPIDNYFVLGEKLLALFPGGFNAFNMAFVLPLEGAAITTRIESVRKSGGEQEALLLDFDFAKTEGLDFSRIPVYLTEAHERSAELFRDLTTQVFRDYIKGDDI
jgi:uncharacterized protein (TIGR04255 family)